MTPGSSVFIIARDPARSIRRGRQLFQRKFTDGAGLRAARQRRRRATSHANAALGAGLADSCAGCHGRPRGSAGFGGDVVTRPDSRDAPHLFGLGLQEMLGGRDDHRPARIARRTRSTRRREPGGSRSRARCRTKGINFGTIRAFPNGSVDTTGVRGVDADLRVRPFFAHGGTISIREFVVGAFNAEMGLQARRSDH